MSALRGNLEDFGIADIFQLIGQQRKTGVLEFSGDAGTVRLRFDRGAVVSAAPVGSMAEAELAEFLVRSGRLSRQQVDTLIPECKASAQTVPRLAVSRGWIDQESLEAIEDLLTRETFFEVLRWERGAFVFNAQEVEHQRQFDALLGAEQILMDGLRMVDEWHSFTELVPSLDWIYQKVAGFEEYRRATSLEPSLLEAAEPVFQLVDGRISVKRIIDLTLLGSFDTVRLIADMVRAEVIEALEPEVVERLQNLPLPKPSVDAREAITWVAGAVSTLLLLLAVIFGAQRSPEPAAALGATLGRKPLEAVRQSYETRALRNAVESHRFAVGSWPRSLDQLVTGPLLADSALAGVEARPYYYVKREDGVILLAPER
ncbi:MAG: DUF4388 domain-containing protein [Myxococcales bacterium]|nr:DUF4388 domain-containing protein [Myxococcales bacterium]